MKNPKNTQHAIKLVPLGDRVLVQPHTEEITQKTKSGIYIPETVQKEKPQEGMVIAVGEGAYRDGKRIPVQVKVGDKVIFSKYAYEEIKIEGKEYYLFKEENILAIIK